MESNQTSKINSINKNHATINLIDMLAVMLKRKKFIICSTFIGTAAAVILSIISLILPPEKSPLPNKYTPVALMLINDSASTGGSLSSVLSSSGLSSLAGITGVSTGVSTYSALAVYIAETNTFLDAIVNKFNLIERYKIKKSPRAESRDALKKHLSASYDKDSGVFSISFTDTDPAFAQSVVNYAADYMEQLFTNMGIDKDKLQKKNLEENIQTSYNEITTLEKQIRQKETSVSFGYNPAATSSIILDTSMLKLELQSQQQVYTNLKTQYEVLKVSMASEMPIFQVFEHAEIPDRKSKPSRGKLCLVVTVATLFFSIISVFIMDEIQTIKQNPAEMAKLTGSKEHRAI
jgi:uncharacterized protein involved in exopolysaccharide biosynthesis